MTHPRRNRPVSAILALFCLLFMQLAVAAYACPKLMPSPSTPMLDGSGEQMVDCAEMDRESPTLCHEHTYEPTPSLDKPATPSVLPFVAAGFAPTLLWPEQTLTMPRPPRVFLHASGTSPPIAIRHCCFRL